MEPLFVVDLLEEAFDRGLGVRQIAVFLPVDLFVLQGLDKRFARRVVPGIRFRRHADWDAVLLKQLGVSARGVLHPTVRVMDQAGGRPPALERPVNARSVSSASSVRSSAQPITRREEASRITAR